MTNQGLRRAERVADAAPLPRRAIFTLCCASMCVISFTVAGPAVYVSAIARELDMGYARQGLFLSALFWGGAASVFLAGILADRLGFRPILLSGATLIAAGFLLLSAIRSEWEAVAAAGLTGAGVGMLDGVLTPLVCALYPSERTRTANLLHAFYPAGIVLSMLGLLALMGGGWGWRAGFVALGMTPLVLLAGYAVVPLPRHSHEGERRMSSLRVARQGAFQVFAVAMFLGAAAETAPTMWVPSLVENAGGGRPLFGALGMLLFSVAMLFGRVSVVAVVRRLGARRLFVFGGALCCAGFVISAIPAGALTGMAAPAAEGAARGPAGAGSPWLEALPAILGLCGVGFSLAGFWPTILACAGDRFPEAGASMFSLLTAIGCAGAIMGPIVVGVVAEQTGLRGAMGAMTVLPLALMWLMGRALRAPAADF